MAVKIQRQPTAFAIREPAQRLAQGGRSVYYFSLPMGDFDDALPTDVDSKIITHNRRFNHNHARAIQDYLGRVDSWVLGPITLSLDPAMIEFELWEEDDGTGAPVIGELRIQKGRAQSLKILDGQHRRRAIRDFRKAAIDGEDQDRLERFDACHMPVALYAEADEVAMRQMFADMAQQRKMDAVTTARFDMRNPFNRAAEEVMAQSSWLSPFVDMNLSTLSRTSNKLMPFNQLATNIKTLQYGYYGRASQERERQAELELPRIIDEGIEWVDDFLPAAREEYVELLSDDLEPDHISGRRSQTVAYNGTMLRIIAGCHFEWRQEHAGTRTDALAQHIHALDLRSKGNQGILVESGVLDLRKVTLVARRQEVKEAIRLIVAGADSQTAPMMASV